MNPPSTSQGPRTDLYTFVHKGQRFRLFQLGARAGSTDPSDATAMAALGAALGAMVRELREHAHHEETFIHPLLAERAPEIGAALEARHHELEARMDELTDAFERARSHGAEGPDEGGASALFFYRSLMRFVALYLEHLDDEEAALPVLWARFTEAELAAVMAAFRATRSPAQGAADLAAMLPALQGQERSAILRGIRANAPSEGFAAACAVAEGALDAGSFAALRSRLTST